MRNKILLLGGGSALFLIACLAAPDEPTRSSSSGLTCTGTEQAFNGACRKVCAANADCGSNETCMKVSDDAALCLEYKHCAYLESDTTCSGAPSGYDNPYGNPYGTFSYDSYGSSYGSNGCTGNATWQVIAPSGDPQCGAAHAVTRCTPVGNSCELVAGSTNDVAEP
jgi:hypothetical protein